MAEPLKLQYDTEDEVPEAAKALYAERDGKWQLTVEGVVSKTRLDEFRTSNIQLRKEVDTLKAKMGGLTTEDIEELKRQAAEVEAEKQRLKEQQLLDEKKIDELIAERTKKVIEDRDKGFKERDAKLETTTRRLRHLTITTELHKSATALKIEPWAIADAVALGERVFELGDDGKVLAYETATDGTRHVRYDEQGEPLTIQGWLAEQVALRPGWMPASAGGGAHHHNGDSRTRGAASLRKSEMSAKERSDYISEHGREAYHALAQ